MVIHPHKTTCIQNKASDYASDINTTIWKNPFEQVREQRVLAVIIDVSWSEN